MSYCVECGVELSGYHEKCPLCQTAVVNPNVKSFTENEDYPDYRARPHGQGKRVRRIMTGLILSVQAVVYSVILLFLDLIIEGGITWSLIPVLSLALAWFGVALPFLKKRNTFMRLFTYDVIAVAIYLFLLNYIISGDFFWSRIAGLALLGLWMIIAGIFLTNRIRRVLPVTLYYILSAFIISAVAVFLIGLQHVSLSIAAAIGVTTLVISLISYFVVKSSNNGVIGLLLVLLIDITVLSLVIDLTLNYYLASGLQLTWSLIVVMVTIPMISTLFVVKRSRELRAMISRKLHR